MRILLIFYLILFSTHLASEPNIDQWKDTDKTYKDLVDEGFEVKSYDTTSIQTQSGLIILFFVTVLQKNKEVYECQEYQTLDQSMQTLDLSFVCREIVQPYEKGVGI